MLHLEFRQNGQRWEVWREGVLVHQAESRPDNAEAIETAIFQALGALLGTPEQIRQSVITAAIPGMKEIAQLPGARAHASLLVRFERGQPFRLTVWRLTPAAVLAQETNARG